MCIACIIAVLFGVTRFTSDNPTTPDKLSTRYNHTVIVCNKHSLFIIHKPVFCRFQRQNRLVSRVSIAGSCHTWGSKQKFLHRTTSTTHDNNIIQQKGVKMYEILNKA